MKAVEKIEFGHSGEIKLLFEGDQSDIKVTIESTNDFDGHHLWISSDEIENFTRDFKNLIEKYFI